MTERLRILSYNIHKGFSSGNFRFVLRQIRDALRAVDPDLVFLQEVHGEHQGHQSRLAEWPNESQFEFLADSVWTHYSYGRNAVYDGGNHGNAILSKFPITSSENINISVNRFEQRGILHAVVEVPGRRQAVHAICTHFNLLPRGRERQIDQLVARVDAAIPAEHPLVIAGDFNDWSARISNRLRHSLGVVEMYQELHGVHARTFPSQFPILQLDRIFCRNLKPMAATALHGAPWHTLSDHVALWAEVVFL